MSRIETQSSYFQRRRILAAALGATGLSAWPFSPAIADNGDIVIGGAQPITGVFAFAGVGLNQGLGDYCEWRNSKGGIAGRKLRYIGEDSGYKMDQAMNIFKKIMGAHQAPLFYGDSTGWAKAVSKEVSQLGSTLTSSPSFSSDLADPKNVPYYFMAGPTYTAMGEILLEYISRSARGATKPAVALVYSDTEFGRDPIAGIKARAQALQLPIVQEIVTKPGAVDISSEVAKLRRAKPDFVIFHGYVLAPIPEFIKQMRESGMNATPMGTIWSMDKTTVEAMGATAQGWMGVMPYRYSYETKDAPMMQTIKDFVAKTRPSMSYTPLFYTHTWLVGMIFSEVIERCLKAGKPLTGVNMKAALESIINWDTGGITGLPVSLKDHHIASGRVYAYDSASKLMEPASGWITTA
ncbi:MAG: ABC transporter substrate-binding protein [Burkholderiales bacterium]|jgi:branched-chain amino acid transport system substrate-binding protein|nr:ABC transporter substrate-binding protein [Burkholderiales bacterium]